MTSSKIPAPLPQESREIHDCVTRATTAQVDWARRPLVERRSLISSWRDVLVRRHHELADAVVGELGKPLSLSRGEVTRAIAHIDAALTVFTAETFESERIDEHVTVTREPVGTVALVMPWNNPIALPVSNIAPALLGGNTVVFKSAPEADGVGSLLMQTLEQAGMPEDVVVRVSSTVDAGRALVRHPSISAVAVTGSIPTGRDIASACAGRFVPVRAELGGNNAVIVLPDADLPKVASDLARNAFSFAGQRCTALRRAVVDSSVIDDFQELLVAEAGALEPLEPHIEDALMGPMVTLDARERVFAQVRDAIDRGALLLAGGDRVELVSGPALSPTVIRCDDPSDPLVQNESFGPVLVVQSAGSLAHAIELANGVEQGLLQAACTHDPVALAQIQSSAEVGIFQTGAAPLSVHDMAAFVGRKASGCGGPEHGRWDLDFYTRPKTTYGMS
jgi:acyl-CoA reductase-like NAD-dependent aldehyde dehydrogenase